MSRSKKASPVKIMVDVHERQSGIAETLGELGAEIEIAPLPAGDYAVGADTLVERKRVLAVLASVPGISTSSARALLDRFGSVAAVVAADQTEWLTVAGIGPERARALNETFNLRRGSPTAADGRSPPLNSGNPPA